MSFSARSCTRPASGPHSSTIGAIRLGPRDERIDFIGFERDHRPDADCAGARSYAPAAK